MRVRSANPAYRVRNRATMAKSPVPASHADVKVDQVVVCRPLCPHIRQFCHHVCWVMIPSFIWAAVNDCTPRRGTLGQLRSRIFSSAGVPLRARRCHVAVGPACLRCMARSGRGCARRLQVALVEPRVQFQKRLNRALLQGRRGLALPFRARARRRPLLRQRGGEYLKRNCRVRVDDYVALEPGIRNDGQVRVAWELGSFGPEHRGHERKHTLAICA